MRPAHAGMVLLRRRYPLAAFGAILLAAWVQLALGVGLLAADLMSAFALYGVAARFRWTVSVPAAGAVVLCWVLVAVAPRLDEYYLSIGELGLLVLIAVWAWTWGTLVRARIAREIHDIVSHGLSAVVLISEGASLKVRSEPERAEQAMLTVRDTGRNALAEMRRCRRWYCRFTWNAPPR